MSDESSHRWRQFVYFILMAVLFLGGLFFFFESFFPEKAQQSNTGGLDARSARFLNDRNRETPNPLATYDADSGVITLLQNQSAEVNGIRIVYHGLAENHKFKFDAYILAFDRQMPFHHTLDITTAKKGFQLGAQRFKLLSAKRNRLQVKHLP